MNLLVKLVNEWDKFEQSHPSGQIEDFCRYYILRDHKNRFQEACPEDYAVLIKIFSHILQSFNTFHKSAMRKTPLPFPEAFFYLNILNQKGELKKTELISDMMVEYTTGMESISKLLKANLISESSDSTDKRVRLLKINARGKKQLNEAYKYLSRIGELIFGSMQPDSLKLCIQLLVDVEQKASRLSTETKNKDFDELYSEHITSSSKN